MSAVNQVEDHNVGRRRAAIMGVILALIAVILPFAYHVDIGPGPDSIRAMIWDYIQASWHSGFRWWNPFDTLPYTLLRIIYPLQIYRYYTGLSSKRRTIVMGLVSELQPFLVSFPLTYGIQ